MSHHPSTVATFNDGDEGGNIENVINLFNHDFMYDYIIIWIFRTNKKRRRMVHKVSRREHAPGVNRNI